MEACARVGSCPLFGLFTIKASLAIWKARYCEGEFGRCERLKLAQELKPVPVNLLPNGKLLSVALDQARPEDLGRP